MRVTTDTTEVVRAIAALNGAGDQVRLEWAKAAQDIGEEAVGFVKKSFRSGPTSDRTTQVRSNRLRASYGLAVQQAPESRAVLLDVGLLRTTANDAKALAYGRMMEGFNEDGSTFASKTIRARGNGFLTFPLYNPGTPGVAKGNIVGWVRTRAVTFRPRPSFPAVAEKFTPMLRAETEAIVREVAGHLA